MLPDNFVFYEWRINSPGDLEVFRQEYDELVRDLPEERRHRNDPDEPRPGSKVLVTLYKTDGRVHDSGISVLERRRGRTALKRSDPQTRKTREVHSPRLIDDAADLERFRDFAASLTGRARETLFLLRPTRNPFRDQPTTPSPWTNSSPGSNATSGSPRYAPIPSSGGAKS